MKLKCRERQDQASVNKELIKALRDVKSGGTTERRGYMEKRGGREKNLGMGP